MNKSAAQITTLATGLLMSIVSCDSLEIFNASFDDYEEVRSSPGWRFWTPPFMPESASAIRVRYDIDTMEAWVGFTFGEDFTRDAVLPTTAVSDLDEVPARLLHRSSDVQWWPEALTQQYQTGDPEPYQIRRGARYFKTVGGICSMTEWHAAIDWQSNKVFYWQAERARCRTR